MILTLFLSYIHDLLSKLDRDFFEKSSGEKENLLKNYSFIRNEEFKKHLMGTTSFDEFLKEVKKALLLFDAETSFDDDVQIVLLDYYDFLLEKIVPVLDKISVKFFVASKEDKLALLEAIFPEKGLFFDNLKSLLLVSSNEEVQELFSIISKKINKTGSLIKIQSARECSPSLKGEIRSQYGENYFVTFQVNTRLLGGMLIYKDGKITDSSWIGKIHALKSI